MKNFTRHLTARNAVYAAIPALAFVAVYSIGQVTPPNIAPIPLAADPLYAQGAGQKPTLTLALSVEFPTVGAQYRGNYNIAETYPGYFNTEKCYSYDKTSSLKHFTISGSATAHDCAGTGFSGNFMNWATSSSIDILRFGLTGGDRIEDTASSTILQRAVIPKDFYDNGAFFPQKNITRAEGLKSLPSSLFENNNTDGVRISNCLNKVYIYTNGVVPVNSGTSACDSPMLMGPILQEETNLDRPNGYTECANDGTNNFCNFTGYKEVIFGTTGKKWLRRLVKNGVKCDWNVLGDPAAGESKKCYIKDTSLTFPMDAVAGGGDDHLFSRAKVCTAADTRASLCQQYPSGHSKPVGNMQKYSDRVRMAAFGYLMDNNRSRYGGVLRAPMTYVGQKSYDANGNAETGTNPYAEWNANDGTFKENPRSESDGISGVINYLNRFGRTGPTAGVYKGLDPLGELYYESLRYLQGLQPTLGAVSDITGANVGRKDGYPVYTSWTDPFDGGSSTKNYACLRNSILTIADKNTHSDKSLPGNTRTANEDYDRSGDVNLAANVPNFVDWTNVIGGFESGNAVAYVDGNGTNRTTTNPTSGLDTTLANLGTLNTGSGGGSAAYYIAGAAYWAHTHDIRGSNWTAQPTKQRPGMRITTYVLDVNEGSASDDATTRHRSQLFLTAKYGGFNDVDGDGNPFTPANDQGNYNNRHWEKENDAGEAKTYFLASNATAVLKALDDIFVAATKVSNTIAAPAISSNQLTTTDNHYYIASFDPEYWSGDLKRNTIKVGANGGVEQGTAATMLSAASVLDARTTARNIVAGKSTNTSSGYGINFTWSDIQSTPLGTQLDKPDAASAQDGLGADRVDFIRGDRSLEATKFRKRNSRMGDIINSGAAYSGVPTQRYNSSAYLTFYNTNKNRTKAVFVGANDGMLHAFNAETMDELFAYIPSWLGPNLSKLTDTSYNSGLHTSYVDATPVVAEAEVAGSWKTVLVSGTGGGGQGVFALDITNPTSFGPSNVLWEFTDAHDPDMGNVVGTPKIVKIRTNAKSASTATYKWFAAVPSGVNNYVNDGTGRFSTTGKPALFLLDLSKPTSDNWTLGTNYFKVSFPVSNSTTLGTQMLDAAGNGTGVGKATGVVHVDATGDANGAVEYFYLGDLHGQFWKLDMGAADLSSSAAATHWDLETLSYFKSNSTNDPLPMYIAKDAGGKVQPISMNPSIAYGPNSGYVVAFGTGKYLEAADNLISTSTQVQSFYVLYDAKNGAQADGTTAGINGRARLQASTVSGTTISTPDFLWAEASNASATPNKKAGWYMDYPYAGATGGERQITHATLFGKKIVFTSLMPPTASTSACGGGSSYTYQANLASGDGVISAVSTGAQGAPLIFHVGSSIGVSDSTGLRSKTDRLVIGTPSSTGDNKISITDEITAESLVGRLSWRQINNYQDLKNQSAGWN